MKLLPVILFSLTQLAWGVEGTVSSKVQATQTIPNVASVSRSPFPVSGVNINMYGTNLLLRDTTDYIQSLNNLVSTGSNTVLVTTPYVQETGTSSSVFADPNITETDANLATVFDALKARGFTVAYKFTLLPSDGSWSGEVRPTDASAWFASYKAHLVRLAALSQAHGVTILYIANEMQSMASSSYAMQWNDVLDGVRAVYSGKLSWNAVMNTNGTPNGEAFNIPVLSRLDHIGLSFYQPLTNKANPTVAEVVQSWYGNNQGNNLVAAVKALHNATDKPIVFSELSYRSVAGNNINPSAWQATPTDVFSSQEQANCYDGFMQVWKNERQAWMLGVLWWQWRIESNPPRWWSVDQSPQNLEAQTVMTRWFTSVKPVKLTPILMLLLD